jgi:hypothetical protein
LTVQRGHARLKRPPDQRGGMNDAAVTPRSPSAIAAAHSSA